MALLAVTTSKGVLALSSSAEFREKALQVVQYVCKLLTACDLGDGWAKRLTSSTAAARRLIKFLGWVKFFKNFTAADAASGVLRPLLFAQASLALGVDVMRDAVTLEKLQLVALPAVSRRWTFARTNELVDAVLAIFGITVAALRLRAALAEDQLSANLSALRVALFKSLCHLGKAADAGKLGGGPGARTGAVCGLLNTLIAARDLRRKLAPPPPAALKSPPQTPQKASPSVPADALPAASPAASPSKRAEAMCQAMCVSKAMIEEQLQVAQEEKIRLERQLAAARGLELPGAKKQL